MACPAKRRRHDNYLLTVSDEELNNTLSRSSSLLQFECLEKQCQDLSSSSPSVFSNFSFDSVDCQTLKTVNTDSYETNDNNLDYHKTLKIDIPRKKQNVHKMSSQNQTGSSESNDSTDSAVNFDATCENSKSLSNLKLWKSFESLNFLSSCKSQNEKSAENLSEDSGYSDYLYNYLKTKSTSIPDIGIIESDHFRNDVYPKINVPKINSSSEFVAYDGEGFQNFSTNFGVSCQDLTNVEKYSNSIPFKRYAKNLDKKENAINNKFSSRCRASEVVNIEKPLQCTGFSNYNSGSLSEPNLLQVYSETELVEAALSLSAENLKDQIERSYSKQSYFKDFFSVCSVLGNVVKNNEHHSLNTFCDDNFSTKNSIAVGNWDIADILFENVPNESSEKMIMSKNVRKARTQREIRPTGNVKNHEVTRDDSSLTDVRYKREGSYLEAMTNRVDLSDDESTCVSKGGVSISIFKEFDKQILKAISETSIQSFIENEVDFDSIYTSTPMRNTKRNVISTPNLTIFKNDPLFNEVNTDVASKRNSLYEMKRKSSLANKSTSTSGTSDMEEKTLTPSKSFSGSMSSSRVHFSPVVSEVNWKDESDTTDKESSSYSLSSTPERDVKRREHRSVPLIRPEPRKLSVSQPELVKVGRQECMYANECEGVGAFPPLEEKPTASSQPEVNVMKRRGSQIIRRDSTGKTLTAYVDADGVMYQHNQVVDTTARLPPSLVQSNHVPVNNNILAAVNTNREKRAVAMERSVPCRDRKSGKLGGFFSRLVSFRFSTRKSADGKNKHSKKNSDENKEFVPFNQQRVATKDDYIYIPLKGPLPDNKNRQDNNNEISNNEEIVERHVISSKPPLPKMPPRVVGASVKRRLDMTAQSGTPEYCIDSGNVSHQPMEPMGLLETDLDTEVTIITSGTNVKTRSLMNLGAEVPVRNLAAPTSTSRPHKSMEYLLDKQNLKVVEVSAQIIIYNILTTSPCNLISNIPFTHNIKSVSYIVNAFYCFKYLIELITHVSKEVSMH